MMYRNRYVDMTVCPHSFLITLRCRNNNRRSLRWHQRHADVGQTLVVDSSIRASQSDLMGSEDGNLADAIQGSRKVLKLEGDQISVHNDSSNPGDPPVRGVAAYGKSRSPYKDLRTLDAEIISIGLPMLATLAADPIAGLVDSAYMGRAGSAQLAAVGVALSIFNTATKLCNLPLLAVTTSTVAKATGEARMAAEAAASASASAASSALAKGTDATAAAPAASLSTATKAKAAATASDSEPRQAIITEHDMNSDGRDVRRTTLPSAATTTAADAATEPGVISASSLAQVRAASACIWLAVMVGLLQACLLLAAGPRLVSIWGVAASSPVAQPALSFLLVRAAGAPVTILMLTLQGVFRGLQDTRTPLQATLVSNAINIALAPILIFGAGLGAVGAAVATVMAQAIPLFLMARELQQLLVVCPQQPEHQQPQQRTVAMHRRDESARPVAAASSSGSPFGPSGAGSHTQRTESVNGVLAWDWSQVSNMLPLFKPTGFLVLRSASATATYAMATALVARGGPAVAASHQICFQLWLACSLLADALAVAAQSLMARDIGAGSVAGARQVASRVSSLSLGLGLVLAVALASSWRLLPGLFSSDPEVLRLVTAFFPVVAAMQPITVLAMAWDGILYGAGGFRYAAVSMALAALPAMGVMQLRGGMIVQKFAPLRVLGLGGADATAATGLVVQLTGDEQLCLVWAGVAVLMLLRWLTIVVPYFACIGPFSRLRTGDGRD
ncbi:hypothetical protein VaNZ11_010796 [Volvox africanus]|uniref:Protein DETOXIFICATION n=1 Tax=Volvox africanus TaxID=51714 RepID=A0ABQ5SA95_9CHLO|nr:hypothetical protein VaNZ11_010796 [Volvox africanus]